MPHNDTAKRIVWRIPPNCVLGACYSQFFLSYLKIQNNMIKISDTEYFSNDKTIRFLIYYFAKRLYI